MLLTSWWIFIASIQLIRLTYQDFKNKCFIDDRQNYFMYGVSFALLTQIQRGFLYILLVVILAFIFKIVLDKNKCLGAGDTTTLSWIFLGLGVINPFSFAIFGSILIIFSLANHFIMKKFKKDHVPYYHIITISFILTGVLFGLYF